MASNKGKALGAERGQVLGGFAPDNQVSDESSGGCTQRQAELAVAGLEAQSTQALTTAERRTLIRLLQKLYLG